MVEYLKELEHGDRIKIITESGTFDNLRILGKIGGKRRMPVVGQVIEEKDYDKDISEDKLVYDTIFDDTEAHPLKVDDGDLYLEIESKKRKVKDIVELE